MFGLQSSLAVRAQWQVCKGVGRAAAWGVSRRRYYPARAFHASRTLQVVKPVLLADIGEGIVECEIIQWFVEPDARVEEFSPLCEVQSDKASVEITSRFSGVVKKLYYEAGEMAKVGKPFVDIDIQGEVKKEDLEALTEPEPKPALEQPQKSTNEEKESRTPNVDPSSDIKPVEAGYGKDTAGKGRHAALATPAVRHLSKELDVDITHINGTGKDGRVLKEDIYRFVENRDPANKPITTRPEGPSTSTSAPPPPDNDVQTETTVQLTNTQLQMFKTMTRSLSIPHFLYADEIDFTNLFELRSRLNKTLLLSGTSSPGSAAAAALAKELGDANKLSYLPFIIKAVSMALQQYPVLNARVEVSSETGGGSGPTSTTGSDKNGNTSNNGKPRLVFRGQHNIGVAMDTPAGLLVPVIRGVNARSVLSVAAELARLQALATAGRLSPRDLAGGTVTVSNIGSIGGTYLSPVIVEREVAILGIGRVRAVPAFDDQGRVVKRHVCNFSYSADHRVVDGATLARAAGVVRQLVEEPDVMAVQLR